MARLARQAIFIPLSNIESYPISERTKEDYDAVQRIERERQQLTLF